ncbi:acyl-CoA dehydrogenase family protein [Micromonospora sp. KC213]|uniref:acyl-CoA dehydrogenase family protein n=1 Tax=Micromonospora sp. KC213 TaxID=2530378 RepID=UPI00104BB5B0|nr:acyl-CoA dehydrogenase family protein [Micromonospora sp. KC213]TDC42871.1 hydrolase [Micromonospora sp. KC213]
MPGQVLRRGDLSAAGQVAALAARHAEDSDAHRTLSPEVIEELIRVGFCRHFVPQRWGGVAGTFTELLAATATVGAGCTSAAWCASLAAGAGRLGAFLPEDGQRELWGDGPDALVVAGLTPTGTASEVPGGWLVRGEWRYVSGVESSDWAFVCGPGPESGQGPMFFLVPRADYRVLDTWFPTGMRGTGSNTVVVDGAFVPRHRAFLRESMWRGHSVGSTARCHTVPLRVASGLLFAAPALGAARGAIAAWSARLGGTRDPASGDRAAGHRDLAWAAGMADAAGLLLQRAAQVADQPSVTPLEAVRNPMDCALAVEQLVNAVQRLFRAAGTSGQFAGEPLQRFWRDVHFLASHAALRLGTASEPYGRQLAQTARGKAGGPDEAGGG